MGVNIGVFFLLGVRSRCLIVLCFSRLDLFLRGLEVVRIWFFVRSKIVFLFGLSVRVLVYGLVCRGMLRSWGRIVVGLMCLRLCWGKVLS